MDLAMWVVVVVCGIPTVCGSVILTSSPETTTDGDALTLICSSSPSGGKSRQWFRDDQCVFYTMREPSSLSVPNTDIFNTFLLGRINTSDVSPHNVTLRIDADKDDGSVWQCFDGSLSQTSNKLIISVVVPSTTVPPTSTSTSSSGTTNVDTTTDVSVCGHTHAVTRNCPDIVIFIVTSAAGGVVVGGGVTLIIVFTWMRMKKRKHVRAHIYASP